MEWFGLVLLALLLSTNWNALEGKRYAKSVRDQLASKHEQRPERVIACPYGYGDCEAFPLDAKPCKRPGHLPDGPTDRKAGSGHDEAPPVG